MPRVSHYRWTKTTPITLARLAGEDDVFVYTGEPSSNDLQAARTLLRETFSCMPATIRRFNAETDTQKITCPNPCCAAKLLRVEKHLYEGQKETQAHFRAARRSDHIDDCVFKNPDRKIVNRGSWRKAFESNQDVVVNLDYRHGTIAAASYQAPSRHYGTPYEHWVSEKGRHNYVTHAVHSTEEFVDFANMVDRFRGDSALDRLWVQDSGHIARYRDTWLAQYDTGLTERAVSFRVLRALYNRGKNFVSSCSSVDTASDVQLAPLLTEVRFNSDFNVKTNNISTAPVAINDSESAYVVNSYHFDKNPGDLKGSFLMVACPRFHLGSSHTERQTMVQTLRDTIAGKDFDFRQPKVFRIEWNMAADPSVQLARVPTLPLPFSERTAPAARL